MILKNLKCRRPPTEVKFNVENTWLGGPLSYCTMLLLVHYFILECSSQKQACGSQQHTALYVSYCSVRTVPGKTNNPLQISILGNSCNSETDTIRTTHFPSMQTSLWCFLHGVPSMTLSASLAENRRREFLGWQKSVHGWTVLEWVIHYAEKWYEHTPRCICQRSNKVGELTVFSLWGKENGHCRNNVFGSRDSRDKISNLVQLCFPCEQIYAAAKCTEELISKYAVEATVSISFLAKSWW